MTVSKKYNAHHYSALKDAQYCIWTVSIYCTYSYWLFLKVDSTSYTETKSWTFIFTQDNKVSITVNLRTINEKNHTESRTETIKSTECFIYQITCEICFAN